MTYILLLLGFVLLIKGAGFLVDGSVSIARRFNVSSLVIGLTIVAFGTSAPELAVNLLSAFHHSTEIAIGNILGSNIANTFLIIGVASIIFPMTVHKNTAFKEIPFGLLATMVVGFLAFDSVFDPTVPSLLSRGDGFVLLGYFAVFLYYIVSVAKQNNASQEQPDPNEKIYSNKKSIAFVLLGLVLLVIGGQWIVNGAVAFAQLIGMKESVIGLTVVAVGTSLPELATSIVAALKKQSDIVIGNVVGSSIFNIFWILGLTSIIEPLPFSLTEMSNVFMACAGSVLLFAALFVGKRHTLKRWQGIVFIFLYVGYIVFLFTTQSV